MNSKPKLRTRKLIKPRIQLRLIAAFLVVSAVGLVLEALLLTSRLSEVAASMPTGGNVLESEIPSLLVGTLLFSFLFLLPLTVAVGVLATFRVAGPVYRFEQHMGALARGEDPGPCRIRRGDEMQELCELINRAVERLRHEEADDPVREAA